ncbi:MAG TPA: AMIN domain-containing protein [Gammaproteobacteria bacterium]|nr:AMIN domain-containing protein [Gammaproteobacteria bacterium]
MRRILAFISLFCLATSSFAVEVKDIRMWSAPDNTRLVFDLSAPVEHTVFFLKAPDRVVIDLKASHFTGQLPHFDYAGTHIRGIRFARRHQDELRFVIDLKNTVQPKSFILKPQGNYGHRLVIDLYQGKKQTIRKTRKSYALQQDGRRNVIIAIDAGHGGDDPGALGRHGTREKDVVLAIARRLEKLVRKEPGMTPVMIRKGDYYVGLKQRVRIARKKRADLFVSIHADAFRNGKAHGSSVFVLSERGASSEVARFLAQSENRSDLIGGISLDDKDDLLKMVLVDMVKNSTIEDSHDVASRVLKNLKSVNHLHKSRVERAGFRVLKAPDVPSILVETAFISNPAEARNLRSSRHQQALANAILKGVRSYFHANPPPGTLLAQKPKRHIIARGETLSGIAARYRISIALLKRRNGLRSNTLQVGKVLRIPVS